MFVIKIQCYIVSAEAMYKKEAIRIKKLLVGCVFVYAKNIYISLH